MTIAAYQALMHARLGLAPDADRATFERAQDERLIAAVAEARTQSPFYRGRTDWPAEPTEGTADLAKLPFTTAADIVRGDPPLAAVSGADIARIVTLSTSGTSGAPKRIAFSAADIEATIDYFQHGMAIFTQPDDRVAIVFAADRPASVGDGLSRALLRLSAVPVPVPWSDDPARLVGAIRSAAADVIAGPPAGLLAAARWSEADGGPPVRPRAVLLSSDGSVPALKQAIAKAWNCEVFDHWGMTETGYGGAVDCPAHDGLHLREADLFIEIVDPVTGALVEEREVGEGTAGEIVFTTLQPRAMPLVRYRTGDRGRLVSGRCSCGSHLRRLVGPLNRLCDEVVVGGMRVSLADIDDAVFAVGGIADAEATLVEGSPPTLTLALRAVPGLAHDFLAAAIQTSLAASPVFAALIRNGQLRLDMRVMPAWRLNGMAKRRLHFGTAACASSG